MKTTKFLALGIAAAIAFSGASAMAEEDGEELFKKKCGACHTVEAGKHKVGPSLHGIVGSAAGSTDFSKYKAMKGASFTWDEAMLDSWITDQKAFLKDHKDVVGSNKTAMSAKVKKAEERAAIIEYLKAN